MADPRDVEYEEFDGASPTEQLIHAARGNNIDLMQDILGDCKSEEAAAELLNNAKDKSGRYVYHIAAGQGLYDMIDWLLRQEGFECDPVSRAPGEEAGDTPLHSAVRFINDLRPTPTNLAAGKELVELMLEAGSEKDIKNRQGITPITLVAPQNPELKDFIKGYAFEDEDEEEETDPAPGKLDSNYLDYDEVAEGDDDDVRSVYSGSDSDDEKEFRRLKEEKAKRAAN
ncbi:ankyrin repeat protein [Sclerotinia borealis F-4128]|uniref:Ankyrin repeat protein n=1 Tax=Sclerotinia borealis (strain F-4128) TaxID=1432307 RepID=W9CFX7_SCLBF|nr:ankyrin repeat protein [Sclerotinia borealis F-4128]